MRLNLPYVVGLIAIACLVLASTFFPLSSAQASSAASENVWISVNQTNAVNSSLYTRVSSNWTLTFEARWSYGIAAGDLITNGTATIQVDSYVESRTVQTLKQNTTSGVFSVSYVSSTPDILTFTPIQMETEDGNKYNSSILQRDSDIAVGLKSDNVAVWWDTFHVSLIAFNTQTSGKTLLTVNVTYLLVPEEGLTLPLGAAFSNQTFLQKIVQGAEVAVNGVKASQSGSGIYTAYVSTWLPTTYALITVSKQNWVTTQTGFSFTHNANESIWLYIAAVGMGIVFAALTIRVYLRKRERTSSSTREVFPLLGGVLLAVDSTFSFYWVLVAVDGTLSGFNWLPLAGAGCLSFVFGLVGSALSMRRRNQALVILAATLCLAVNSIAVKASFDQYQLAAPWVVIGVAFVSSLLSGMLVSNSEEQFEQKGQKKAKVLADFVQS
jgi:hypothetical protein